MTHFKQPYIVFVGLGNPGPQYDMTRHNMGFCVVKAFGRQMGWNFKEEKQFNAYVTKGVINGTTVHLMMPTTYMNLSGIAIRRYLDFFKLSASHLIVIVDDIAIPFGKIRLRLTGSSGGHNGLKSVESHLGTTHYKRLRMGIGHPGENVLAEYVLAPFSREELEQLQPFIDRGVEVLQHMLEPKIQSESQTQIVDGKNNKPPVG